MNRSVTFARTGFSRSIFPITAIASLSLSAAAQETSNLGIFERAQDIGPVNHAGSAVFQPDQATYTLRGSGENMWFAQDAFHFLWKQASGDLALAATIAFEGKGTDPHRKACLLFRQDLEPDSVYVDVALHGDGLTSLQFRTEKGGPTREVQANLKAPRRFRLDKKGKYVRLFLTFGDGPADYSGAAVRLELADPFYVGLGVCAHNKDTIESARFTNVELAAPTESPTRPRLVSTLETMTLASTDRRVVNVFEDRIESPNWARDGKSLIYNSAGRLYRIPVPGGEPSRIDTGFATRCNNDHGLSPDGNTLVVSDQSQGTGRSLIYTLPLSGGTPRRVTSLGPSYWHGWSPDGKTLAYCAERNGEFDIYTIPVAGGPELRLTTAEGLDDGPDYSPDGEHIYFNSDRGGRMQIWRMRTDGSSQEQITNDEFNNWFPHPSPDGRTLVFLSYEKDVSGHPENKDVTLRRLTLESRRVEILARFLGGQGTINVPSWSPDGRQIAFVTYQLIP
jgi:Tol biopolymer transport system component